MNILLDAIRIAGLPMPEYRYNLFGYFLKLNLNSHNVPVETSGKTSGIILELIRSNNQITIPELAGEIGVTERSIQRNIQMLQQNGELMRIGPAKGGYWKILEE